MVATTEWARFQTETAPIGVLTQDKAMVCVLR